MRNPSMKASQTKNKPDSINFNSEPFFSPFRTGIIKLPFSFAGLRTVKGIRATLVDPQNLWYEKLLQPKFARASSFTLLGINSPFVEKRRFFTSKRYFISLWEKNRQKKSIDRFANLIMCAPFTKGAKKSGKKTLAYKLFLNSLFQYRHQINLPSIKREKLPDGRLRLISSNDHTVRSEKGALPSRISSSLPLPFPVSPEGGKKGVKKGAKKEATATQSEPLATIPFVNEASSFRDKQATFFRKNDLLNLHEESKSVFEQNQKPIINTMNVSVGKIYKKVNNKTICQPINSISKQEFKQILFDLQFHVETRKVRIGGAMYQVPSIINKSRQEGLAMRSLIFSAINNKRTGAQTFESILSLEFIAARNKESSSRQRRDQTHNNALNNRAYARYRWW